MLDEDLGSLGGDFFKEIEIDYFLFGQIRAIFNEIQVEVVDGLQVLLEALELIHLHLFLDD